MSGYSENQYGPSNLVMASFVVYSESPCECEGEDCTDPAEATLQVSDLRATMCQTHFLQVLALTMDAWRDRA